MSSELLVVGPQFGALGSFKPLNASQSGSQRANNVHGNFFDAAYYDRLFSGGSAALVAINNATFTLATLGATATPVIGVWNPANSPKNISILQATLAVVMTALQATGPGGFVWAVSTGNAAITTGLPPWNRKTLSQSGAYGKYFSNVALTGLTNNLQVMGGSALGGGSAANAAFLATQVAMQTQQIPVTEFVDGAILVPPGGVLALLAGSTPVAHSVAASILWEELPLA